MMNLLSFNKLSLSIPLSPLIKQLDHCFPVSLDKCFLQLPVSMRRNIWIFSRDVSEQRNQFCALVAYFFPQNLDYFACQASKIIPKIKKKKSSLCTFPLATLKSRLTEQTRSRYGFNLFFHNFLLNIAFKIEIWNSEWFEVNLFHKTMYLNGWKRKYTVDYKK